MFPRKSFARISLLGAAALIGSATSAQAQFTFSIDYLGPTNGVPNSFSGLPIRPSDILTPATMGPFVPGFPMIGPLPFPGTLIPGGAAFASLAIPTYAGCIPVPPGVPCPNEVDALSYGIDSIPPFGVLQPPGTWVFSVDEFAIGIPGFLPPTTFSEGSIPMPVLEAGSDAFQSLAMTPIPMPFGPIFGNAAYVDGNGMVSLSGAVYPGVGIIEPRPLMVGPGARPGDNIDALDVGPPAGMGGIYFSLDGAFPDPLRAIPNTGSAAANGFLGGMILNVPAPGAPIAVWAIPPMLGLDLMGPGTDDLDALALTENGIPFYQPGPGGDIVRFSVRRGSAVIGMLDSLIGAPIEPGDILGPPIALGMTPQLIVSAEALGLATARGGFAPFGDDMDGLDALYTAGPVPPIFFCEPGVAGVMACPCGNPPGGPGQGCNNTALTGGAFLSATGAASLGADTLVFTASAERPTVLSIMIQHTMPTVAGAAFGHGVRCMAGPFKRLYQKTSVAGSVTMPGALDMTISARSAFLGAPIAPGSMRYYGIYYRDGAIPPCPNPSSNYNIGVQAAQYWVP